MTTEQLEYSNFICSICESYDCASATKPLQEAFGYLCEAIANDKPKWIRRIYNATQPLTSHLYKDDNWAGVYRLLDTIKQAAPEVQFTFGATDGGYSNSGEDGMPRRKTYEINGTTPNGKTIVGQLHCDAAGTVENPFSAYDMTLILN